MKKTIDPIELAMSDRAYKSEADECILAGREALANAYKAIHGGALNKATLKSYTVVFDKQYFKACGIGVLANIVRELMTIGYPNDEIRALLLHFYPQIQGNQRPFVSALDLSFVYLLECSGRHKIGVSGDVPQRIRLLQTGAPFPVSLANYAIIGAARVNEKELHRHFSAKRKSGEWFELDSADIDTFYRWKQHGIPTLL